MNLGRCRHQGGLQAPTAAVEISVLRSTRQRSTYRRPIRVRTDAGRAGHVAARGRRGEPHRAAAGGFDAVAGQAGGGNGVEGFLLRKLALCWQSACGQACRCHHEPGALGAAQWARSVRLPEGRPAAAAHAAGQLRPRAAAAPLATRARDYLTRAAVVKTRSPRAYFLLADQSRCDVDAALGCCWPGLEFGSSETCAMPPSTHVRSEFRRRNIANFN